MLPYIFPEIYEHILNQLPVREGFELDDSTRTLAQCAASNSTLRAIACLTHIWKPHYQARWKHSSRTTKLEHVARMLVLFHGDYRRMYIDRRQRDKRALDALDRIVRNRNERHELSLVLIDELGTDILDVLKAHKASIPKNFKSTTIPSEDWFARNHWIDEVRRGIILTSSHCLNLG
jgi:F-box protein 21